MAGPGGREVGRVSVRAVPDTSGFAAELNAYLERIERRLELEIPVSLNSRTVAQTEAELALLTRDREIDIEMNTQALVRGIGGVTSRLARWAPLIVGATVAIGALVAALPAAVSLVAAPIAAIALGWDGVKKAASGLTDEVEHLKQVLSGTFEQLLTPGFERLADLFAVLEPGLDGIATGISAIFDSFSRAVTSTEGMKAIGDILTSIGDSLSTFAQMGGVSIIADSLLMLADAGTKATEAITPDFVALMDNFNDSLQRMTENGDLAKGMEGIGHAFLFFGYALGAVVLAGIQFMAGLERIGEAITTFVTQTIPEGWAAVKASTAATWRSVTSTISKAWSNIKGTVTTAIANIVSTVKSLPGRLASIGSNAANAFSNALLSKLNALVSKVQSAISKIVSAFADALKLGSPSRIMIQYGEWTGEGFAIGLEKSLAGVKASALLVAEAPVRAASATSLAPSAPASAPTDRPIYTDTGVLLGWIRQVANGEARLVFRTEGFEAGVYA